MARLIMAITAILQLICGSTTIDLLDRDSGLLLRSWRPAIAPVKDGGVWQNSPLANGRRLAQAQRDNIIDTFTFDARSGDQDATIQAMQDLRRWLELAQNYWVAGDPAVQPDVPYIKARAANETNTRYAAVYRGDCLEDEEAYAQPFYGIGCRSTMAGLTLAIEHGDWFDSVPGTSSCVQVAGTGTGIDVVTVTSSPAQSADDAWCFDGGASFSIAGVNLPLGYFTDGPTIIGVRFPNVVVPKGATIVDAYITFYADNTDGNDTCKVFVRVQEADNPAVFSTYADFASRIAPRPSYPVLLWPNSRGGSIEHWTADATYTTRNDCPLIRTQVQALVDRTGWASGNAMAFFFIDAGSSATPAVRRASSWDHADPDTPPELTIVYIDDTGTTGRTATCNNEVYVANKENKAALTHIFWNSGADWSGNLIGAALPYALFDNPIANADYVYFGVSTADPSTSGPFSSLVFDIGTPAVYTAAATMTWQYYNGGWVTLTTRDNTASDPALTLDPFVQSGVNSVHWAQPSDWAPVAINGVTAYWVRAAVTIGGGDAITTPTQQNRDVYTITWPYVSIAAAQVAGDLPALARIYRTNESGNVMNPDLGFDRLLVGLRSTSRGTRFTPFINISDEQNDPGIGVFVGAPDTVFAADTTTPTGRNATYTSPGASGAGSEVGILFSSDLTPEYHGTYRVFLRAKQEAATTVGQVEVRLNYNFPGGRAIYTPYQSFSYVNSREVLDFGRVTIPYAQALPTEETAANLINIYVRYSAAGVSIYFYDLILFPVDEWAGSFDYGVNNREYIGDCIYFGVRRYLDVDSIGNPRFFLRALLNNVDLTSESIVGNYRTIANGPAILQANRAQRLYFFTTRHPDTATANVDSDPEEAGRVQVFRQQRYFSSRGDR